VTVVVGFNWLSEMVMIADTRVSWSGSMRSPQDILKKLYVIQSPSKAAVLGFSGDVHAAKTVMVHLKDHKFQNYSRPFVMANLKDDLGRWIEEVTATKLRPETRANLKFMLCGIEPSRHPPVKRDNKVVGFLTVPEAHIYVYTVGKDSGKVMVSKVN
jgi:hypothetical protein